MTSIRLNVRGGVARYKHGARLAFPSGLGFCGGGVRSVCCVCLAWSGLGSPGSTGAELASEVLGSHTISINAGCFLFSCLDRPFLVSSCSGGGMNGKGVSGAETKTRRLARCVYGAMM